MSDRFRIFCAPVAAPNPASFGFNRAGLSDPSARNCGLRTVRSVGLLYSIVVLRALMIVVLNALNTSSRNWS